MCVCVRVRACVRARVGFQPGPVELARGGRVDGDLLNSLSRRLPGRSSLVADKYSVCVCACVCVRACVRV